MRNKPMYTEAQNYWGQVLIYDSDPSLFNFWDQGNYTQFTYNMWNQFWSRQRWMPNVNVPDRTSIIHFEASIILYWATPKNVSNFDTLF